jgi:hypothetical protein
VFAELSKLFNIISLHTVSETGREIALHDTSEWLHEIELPTAVMCTEQDRAIPADHQREMAGLMEGRYDDGHMACMDPTFAAELVRACHHVVQQVGKNNPCSRAIL